MVDQLWKKWRVSFEGYALRVGSPTCRPAIFVSPMKYKSSRENTLADSTLQHSDEPAAKS